MKDLNRRTFLGGTAGLAAGVFVAGNAAGAQSASDQPLNVAIMGLGSRGPALARSFGKQAGVTIATVCDPDEKRLAAGAAAIAKRSGTAPKAEPDIRRVLDDKAIDILVVAAPNHWHGPATIMACNAGKHVYCEKPACHNPAEGEMMIAAAAKNNRCVQIGTQRRSSEAIAEGIKLVHDGAIGDPYYARSWYANQRGPIGHAEASEPPAELNYALWEGPAPHKPYHANYLHYNWHWFWHWGNGEIGNNGTHSIDLCRWALKADYPTAAVLSGGRYAYADDQETPDTNVVSFKFGDDRQIMWEGLSCNRHGLGNTRFGATVHGNGGTLALTSTGYVLYDDRGKKVKENSTDNGESNHIANLLAAIRADDPSQLVCGPTEGHKSTLLTQLGNISHRVGRSITCSSENGHVEGDKEAMALWSREYAEGWEPKV